MAIKSFKDLLAWQRAMDLTTDCYELTRTFPREELFGLTSQIRRSSASIACNIAEGYGRRTRGEYLHFLGIALGSLRELETQIILCGRTGTAPAKALTPIIEQLDRVGGLLHALTRSLERRT